MKKLAIFLTSIFLFFSLSSVSSADFFSDIFRSSNQTEIPYCQNGECGLDNGVKEVKGGIFGIKTDGKASDYIQGVIVYLLGFLALVAIIIIIYAGFNILISAGEDDKIKKSKSMIMYAVIGLVIIFLAGPITLFVIGIFNRPTL